MENSIHFHCESIDFTPSKQDQIRTWINAVIDNEQNTIEYINFIFCNDEYLHQINVDYLQHDTYTDVITFPYNAQSIEGDIFISIDRVKENAQEFQATFEKELYRVMIHGVLHLLGYLDKSKADKEQMTQKENDYLNLLYKDIS